MIRVQFYSLLRLLLKQDKVELAAHDGETVGQLLKRLQQQISAPFLHKLLDEKGGLHAGTIILVNRRNIHHLNGLETILQEGDTLALFPPGAGG